MKNPLNYIKFLLVGVLFGITLAKAEVVSWYRIQEMFRFQSFHMYGIIGSAVVLGVIIVALIKHSGMTSTEGTPIHFNPKKRTVARYLFGGTIFGLGWAMTGACPGPMYILVGVGFPVFLVVILGALLGTFFYGLIKDKLPH